MNELNTEAGKAYLIVWGNYYKHGNAINIGYLKKEPFIDGPGVIRSTALAEEINPDVILVDNLVKKMEKKIQDCLKLRFIGRQGQSLRDVDAANLLRIPVKTYRDHCERGIWAVAGAVSRDH